MTKHWEVEEIQTWLTSSLCSACSCSWAQSEALLSWAMRAFSCSTLWSSFLSDSSSSSTLKDHKPETLSQGGNCVNLTTTTPVIWPGYWPEKLIIKHSHTSSTQALSVNQTGLKLIPFLPPSAWMTGVSHHPRHIHLTRKFLLYL